MASLQTPVSLAIGLQSAGMLLTPEEFDAIHDFDENYRYELVHGVLVVNPIPLPEETGPNELLGFYLLQYRHNQLPQSPLDDTLPQQYVSTSSGRRLADRLIWTGLGRLANPNKDNPTIAVEFVSAGKRNWTRDYVDKKQEYEEAGLKEYWIFDRFQRTLTVVQFTDKGPKEIIIHEGQTYESPLLPGFIVPLDTLLEAADKRAGEK